MGIILSFLDCSKDEIVCYIEISELSITHRDYMLSKIHLLKLIYVINHFFLFLAVHIDESYYIK